MDNNSNNEENNEEVEIKMGFFKKLWYSITKIEKYPEMSAQGFGKALSYVARLVIIFSIVLCIWLVIEAYGVLKNGLDYLQNEFPDFSYKDGILTVESQEPIIIDDENSPIGKVIVDTNTESQEQINQYENSIGEENSGIIILKDKLLIKNMSVANSIEYNYAQTFKDMNITEFDKQTIIGYCNGIQMYDIFGGIYLILFAYTFIMYFISTLWYIAIISIVGYLTSWILKIRMRYVAIFNMAVYSITLSVILNIIYLIVNMFIPFTIQYFKVMYVAVATIYLIAAIFIIKSEMIKKQIELMKIEAEQQNVKKEIQEQENPDENKDTKKEDKNDKENKKEKEKKKDKDENLGDAPEGSKA